MFYLIAAIDQNLAETWKHIGEKLSKESVSSLLLLKFALHVILLGSYYCTLFTIFSPKILQYRY